MILRLVWLVVLNGGNGNDLWCKISSKVPYHYHGNETLIKKVFLFTNFHYHLIRPLLMVNIGMNFMKKMI